MSKDGRNLAGGLDAQKNRKIASLFRRFPSSNDESVARRSRLSLSRVKTLRKKLNSKEHNPDNIEVTVNNDWGSGGD